MVCQVVVVLVRILILRVVRAGGGHPTGIHVALAQ